MSAAAHGRVASSATLTIGDVLAHLKPEFPDLTISKIRFLEGEGLVQPERTPSGYRKFSAADVSRLRYVLAQQKDHYLPLKVIKEQLEAIDRGLVPPGSQGTSAPRVPHVAMATIEDNAPTSEHFRPAPAAMRLSREDLLNALADTLSEKFGVTVEVRPADLADTADRAKLIDELATRDISILCANAGTATFGPVSTLDPEVERAQVQLNAVAVHDMVLAVLRRMAGARPAL